MNAVIVTGSTGGLGKSLVEVLSDENEYDLICLYRNEQKFKELLFRFHIVKNFIVRKNDNFDELVKSIECIEYEEIVLILNAFSIAPIKAIGDFEEKEIDDFINGNITTNLKLLNAIVKHCKSNRIDLRIVNLDSGAADFPLQGWGNYCAAKAYINSFLCVVKEENPDYKVVSIDPGVMDTNMQEEIRKVDKTVFDKVDTFIAYKKDNKLRNPLDVATQIKERYICNWEAKELREKIR